MYNNKVENILLDCDNELKKLSKLIDDFGSTAESSGYFTKYSLLKVASILEISYKTLIADYYESLSPDLRQFVSSHVRDANMNASYANICTMLGWFSDDVKSKYKQEVQKMKNKDRYLNEFKELNDARNNLVHYDGNVLSFIGIKEKFNHVKVFLEILDKIIYRINIE